MNFIFGEDYVKKLIEDVREDRLDVNEEIPFVSFPLSVALSLDSVELATILLEKGANPRKKNSYGVSPMDIALKNGQIDFVELFQKYGGEESFSGSEPPTVDMQDLFRFTHRFFEGVRMENLSVDGFPPMSYFMKLKCWRRRDIEDMKKEDYRTYLDGTLPPLSTWEEVRPQIIEIIKEGKASVNDSMKGSDVEFHPLLLYIYYNSDITELMDLGADPHLKNMDGVSPYSYCMEQGLVEYLDIFEKYETPVKEPSS
jgi:ankyrin repeat protein